MKEIKYPKFIWIFLLLALLAPPVNCPAAASQAMLAPHEQPLPLLPFLNYILDTSLDMDIEEASRATGWQPFIPDKLPMKEGVLWLRFEIAPHAPDARPRTYLLDMGQSVPGTPLLFDPIENELSGAREWRESVPESRNILLLPEASSEAITCYIRMDGLPGPWFAPMIRTPRNAASDWASLSHTAAVLALAMVMLLCLLRGVSERGQWRYWTAMFVAVALLQALLGLPTVNDSFNLAEMAAVMSPGIALMLMPHACRHLMQPRKYSRAIDIQLFLLAFPGAILAVLPLVPGWTWLYRWLDLWPLATVIFIPTALGAWMLSIPGARRFLLTCLIPPIFTACALLGVDFGLPANVLASGPTWGIVLAALLLGTTKAPSPAQVLEEEAGSKQVALAKAEKPALPLLDIEPEQEEIINLEHPLDDPNLRIIPSPSTPPADTPEPPELPVRREEAGNAPLSPPGGAEEWENALRKPLDEILREGAALLRCSLPASARQYAENMIESVHKLANMVTSPGLVADGNLPEETEESFNLQRILRNAHDSVAASAESSGIALSWYTPPHIGQLYRGDARRLESTLSMLLESSVRSSHHGAIKVSVKRVPNSADPGHLLFTVTDDGNGYPPLDRSSLALVHAWELAGRYNGYLSVESSQHGATIAFTAHFEPLGESRGTSTEQDQPHIILIGDDAEGRRQLARIVETLPYMLTETDAPPEAISNQVQKPASLVITQGRFARPAAADMIRQLVRIAREAGIKCHTLAVTLDEKEWPLLKASGFTHAMLAPVDPEILKRTVKELTEQKVDESEHEENEQLPETLKDKTPSMLIEQNFHIAPVFEGPDWLGDPEEENGEQKSTQPDVAESAPESAGGTPRESQTDELDIRAHSSAPEDAVEWIGEPMPVQSSEEREQRTGSQPSSNNLDQIHVATGPTPAPGEQAPQAGFHAPEDAVDWVGEPTPIVNDTSEKEPQADKRELLDFIVGVNQKPTQTEKAPSPVRSFVESSVNMVTSTISSILRQKGKQEMPLPAPEAPEEEIKARSDPAIIALLERLDASMRHANAAFAARNAPAIAESTGLIASDAEKFGLRQLARMARCIERAALANNMGALSDLLPELGIAVERNRITLAERKEAES